MGGSRPQRHPKATVSYKEDDDDEFLSNALAVPEISGRRSGLKNGKAEDVETPKGRRSLALKKSSRTQERVGQQKKAVNESRNAANSNAFQIVNSDDEDLIPHNKSNAFQCLLDVASGARVDGEMCAPADAQESTKEAAAGQPQENCQQEKQREAVTADDSGKLHVQEEEPDLECNVKRKIITCIEEKQEPLNVENEETGTKDGHRREKLIEEGAKTSPGSSKRPKEGLEDDDDNNGDNDDDDDNWSEGEEDKEDEGGEESWNESSDASDSDHKPVTKKRGEKGAAAKQQPKATKKMVKSPKISMQRSRQVTAAVSSPKNFKSLLPKKRPALWVGAPTCSSPGGTPLNVESPSVAHRRVVGLSRRHRPPPLHPYLAGS